MSTDTQPALPGEIEAAWEDDRVECYVPSAFNGRKRHLWRFDQPSWSRNKNYAFCPIALMRGTGKLVPWHSSVICKSCKRSLRVFIRDFPLPLRIQQHAKLGWDSSDRIACLVRADFLAESQDPQDQNIAEAIRCYWEIKSDEISVPRKLALLKRMRELIQ